MKLTEPNQSVAVAENERVWETKRPAADKTGLESGFKETRAKGRNCQGICPSRASRGTRSLREGRKGGVRVRGEEGESSERSLVATGADSVQVGGYRRCKE